LANLHAAVKFYAARHIPESDPSFKKAAGVLSLSGEDRFPVEERQPQAYRST